MIDEFIEPGSIIGDSEANLWRVPELTSEGLFVVRLPERTDIVHTGSVSRERYDQSYALKLP